MDWPTAQALYHGERRSGQRRNSIVIGRPARSPSAHDRQWMHARIPSP
jgi:hypothetical protein